MRSGKTGTYELGAGGQQADGIGGGGEGGSGACPGGGREQRSEVPDEPFVSSRGKGGPLVHGHHRVEVGQPRRVPQARSTFFTLGNHLPTRSTPAGSESYHAKRQEREVVRADTPKRSSRFGLSALMVHPFSPRGVTVRPHG